MPYKNPEHKRANSRRWYAANRERLRDYNRNRQRVYAAANPRRIKDRDLRHKYGFSLAQWEQMFESQNGACAICKTTTPDANGWHTDHCHEKLIVRGILCHACNTSIGKFKHNPELLRTAAVYLERYA